MREITFRGKTNDQYNARTGEWIYGQLLVRPVHEGGMDEYFICETGHKFIRCLNKVPCTYKVDPETVGQYTGLADKNGKRIFEGDIVKTHYANTPKSDFIEQVVFLDGRFCCLYEFGKSKIWSQLHDKDFKLISDYSVYKEWCEVIGNIHDNPELIAEVRDEI